MAHNSNIHTLVPGVMSFDLWNTIFDYAFPFRQIESKNGKKYRLAIEPANVDNTWIYQIRISSETTSYILSSYSQRDQQVVEKAFKDAKRNPRVSKNPLFGAAFPKQPTDITTALDSNIFANFGTYAENPNTWDTWDTFCVSPTTHERYIFRYAYCPGDNCTYVVSCFHFSRDSLFTVSTMIFEKPKVSTKMLEKMAAKKKLGRTPKTRRVETVDFKNKEEALQHVIHNCRLLEANTYGDMPGESRLKPLTYTHRTTRGTIPVDETRMYDKKQRAHVVTKVVAYLPGGLKREMSEEESQLLL